MDLANKQVTHKSFGKGSVVKNDDSYVEVHFPLGTKKFVFPDAFGTYLTLHDKKAANLISKEIEKREDEEKEVRKLKLSQYEKQYNTIERKKLLRTNRNRKVHPSSQVVFWCKGQDKEDVFNQWSVFTGAIKSGPKKGEPNRLIRINQNSACLMTSRDADKDEKDRRILGVFMVEETFIGKLCEDGNIPAHTEHKIQLTEEESKKMLFWNYYSNERYPEKMTWKTGRYRYFDNIWMAQILQDIVSLRKDTEGEAEAKSFFKYYCQLNKINEEDLPEPNGTLKAMVS